MLHLFNSEINFAAQVDKDPVSLDVGRCPMPSDEATEDECVYTGVAADDEANPLYLYMVGTAPLCTEAPRDLAMAPWSHDDAIGRCSLHANALGLYCLTSFWFLHVQ